MRVTLCTAQLVENQVARDFQQPRREFGARDISARAFPDADKDLLRDVFHIGVAAQHARHGPRHQSLMFFDELLECAGIASTHQLHEPQVVSVFFRSPSISFLVARHWSLRRSHETKLARKMETGEKSRCRTQTTVFVASRKRPVHAWPAIYPRVRMNYQLIPKELRPIAERVEAHQRISEADAIALYCSNDLNALGMIANVLRERKNGNYATYIHNRYINYSNICILSCQFCAFAAKKRDAHAFEYAIDEIVSAVQEALPLGITEVHMVGGLHPTLKKEWYLDLLHRLRALDPDLHIKAFTAIEVRHLSQRIFRMPIRDMLETLREAGLGSITGGGAEIFDPIVRDQICRGKETAAEWLDVHRMWHQMGGRSTCTMLYGHIETPANRVDHLRRLRELQDETSGFTGFVPFAFEPSQSHGVLADIKRASAFEQLRNLAVSRIYLDNIDHLTAYWVSLGLPLAQVSLSYGVDDLHGTILEEKIFHMAGATTPQQQTVAALEHAIREAGREPVQRDSHYRHISQRSSTANTAPAPAELACA
jgi:aminodeoxyfutalosine synthase